MSAILGINVDSPDGADPAAIAATGAKWVRLVYREPIHYRPWLLALQARGVDVLFVGDSSPESLGDDESRWADRMGVMKARYGDIVKCVQWGNEPDWGGVASWTMPKDRVNRLLGTARAVFPAGQYTLACPGLVSGQPSWLNGIRTDLVDAICPHPYAKAANTPELEYMLTGYRVFGKPLWCTEFDSRTAGMAAYLRDYPSVERAAVFCWDSGQTAGEGITGMGIRQNPTAMADFVAATGGPVAVPPVVSEPPVEQPARYQLGFADWAARDSALLGEPLENERGGVPGFSQQLTSRGILTAANLIGKNWSLFFWERDSGARYVFDGGRSVRVA